MPADVQNPSSVVWVFAVQQQQSGSGVVAVETVHAETSLHQWLYLENVLIRQPFFESPFQFLLCFLPVCLVQSVPGL